MDSLSVVDIKRLIQSRIEVQTVLIDEMEADHITYTLAIKDFVIKQLKYSIDILKLLSGDIDVEALNQLDMNEYDVDMPNAIEMTEYHSDTDDDNYRALNRDDE